MIILIVVAIILIPEKENLSSVAINPILLTIIQIPVKGIIIFMTRILISAIGILILMMLILIFVMRILIL